MWSNILRKCVFVGIVLFSVVVIDICGMQAPYLISATALSDSSVELSWRNNSIETNEFILLRKKSGADGFSAVDTVPKTVLEYTDTDLDASTKYSYALLAASEDSMSDTSNVVEVTTHEAPDILMAPELFCYWRPDSGFVRLTYSDASNCEDSFVIYRATSSDTQVIRVVKPGMPPQMLNRNHLDSTFEWNESFQYWVDVWSDTTRYSSNNVPVYTLSAEGVLRGLKHVYPKEKLGEIPILFKNKLRAWARYGGLVMLRGDSLLLSEKNAPESSLTVIDVSNSKEPKFAGYLKTDCIECSKGMCTVSGNMVLTTTEDEVFLYEFIDNEFVKKDSLSLGVVDTIEDHDPTCLTGEFLPLNDSTVLVDYFIKDGCDEEGPYRYMFPLRFSFNSFEWYGEPLFSTNMMYGIQTFNGKVVDNTSYSTFSCGKLAFVQ